MAPGRIPVKGMHKVAVLWVLAVLLGSALAIAQTANASIVGVITDPWGAAVLGATVTVTNLRTTGNLFGHDRIQRDPPLRTVSSFTRAHPGPSVPLKFRYCWLRTVTVEKVVVVAYVASMCKTFVRIGNRAVLGGLTAAGNETLRDGQLSGIQKSLDALPTATSGLEGLLRVT
jgi:hypothetical protein